MWWTDGNGYFHQGDQGPGERAATDAEVATWLSSLVTIQQVQAECQRRIDLVVTDNQKLNMLGMMVAEIIQAIGSPPNTAPLTADGPLFLQSMQWIAAMRSAMSGLVGNVAYNQDASWPALSDDLKAFGARF